MVVLVAWVALVVPLGRVSVAMVVPVGMRAPLVLLATAWAAAGPAAWPAAEVAAGPLVVRAATVVRPRSGSVVLVVTLVSPPQVPTVAWAVRQRR